MPSLPDALKLPLWIIEQATLNIVGLVIAVIWIATLAMLIWKAKAGWSQAWPTLILPLPWIALAVWAGLHARSVYGPQTGFHADVLGMLASGLTIGLSVFAIVKANKARLSVFSLVLLNGWFCFVAAFHFDNGDHRSVAIADEQRDASESQQWVGLRRRYPA